MKLISKHIQKDFLLFENKNDKIIFYHNEECISQFIGLIISLRYILFFCVQFIHVFIS